MAKMLTPEEYAASGTEHAHQTALFMWSIIAGMNEPLLRLMFAIPNGGERNVIVATNLKAEGVKSGVPDVMLPVPRGNHAGLFIEMKKLKGAGSRVAPEQAEWHKNLTAQFYRVEVCWGWLEARAVICNYMRINEDGTRAQ
jgi:hypothetical protein